MKKVIFAAMIIGISTGAFAQDKVSKEELRMSEDEIQQYKNKMQAAQQSPEYKEQVKKITPAGLEPPAQGFNGDALKGLQAMNKCLQEKPGPGKEGMQRISQAGKAMEAKVKVLCKEGKRDEAMQMQKDFAIRMSNSADFKAMRACLDQHKDMANNPMTAGMHMKLELGKPATTHVCD